MTDDLVKRLRRDLASEFAAIIDRSEEAADRIELVEQLLEIRSAQIAELHEKIGWLEDKIARIQYTNLRRDMNAKVRIKIIEAICKERKTDD